MKRVILYCGGCNKNLEDNKYLKRRKNMSRLFSKSNASLVEVCLLKKVLNECMSEEKNILFSRTSVVVLSGSVKLYCN